MYPPPGLRTSSAELVGSTTAIIFTVIVACIGLAVLLISVYWASNHPDTGPRGERRQRGKAAAMLPAGGQRSAMPKQADSSGSKMISSAGAASGGQEASSSEPHDRGHSAEGGSHHAKPSSWALVAVVTAAFIAGGLAIITHTWWLAWTCGGIVVLAIPVGKAIGIMDDTVVWAGAAGEVPQEAAAGAAQGQPDDAHGVVRSRQ